MPIKCPVAPLELTFLADWWFTKKGIRPGVELSYVTPLPGAFTKQTCSRVLGGLLAEKKINLVADFALERVDAAQKKLVSYDGWTVAYDLLVTVPTNMGAPVIGRSGLGDDLNFVPTDRHTLQSKARENIFAIGDATDLPSSKAGSVAHF
ncbi:MAG: FAD/NAD(P)-binding oxidoreductase, partial [Chitinivibrionales bacterium]|nr:FAD/NAD(P)-binding oxidoreductase [Chitinivibrionales bacterium]